MEREEAVQRALRELAPHLVYVGGRGDGAHWTMDGKKITQVGASEVIRRYVLDNMWTRQYLPLLSARGMDAVLSGLRRRGGRS